MPPKQILKNRAKLLAEISETLSQIPENESATFPPEMVAKLKQAFSISA